MSTEIPTTGRDCPKCDGGRMYPWDASLVSPDAESRVEWRCTYCGHREPINPDAGADAEGTR